MCQRPKRALFISTYAKEKERKRHEMPCVNALNGLSSFLRLKKWTQYYLHSCVNALNGLSSFLQRLAFIEKNHPELCQRPKRALFISTALVAGWIMRGRWCVNALNGLSSFLQSIRHE